MKAFIKPYTEDTSGNKILPGYYEISRIYVNEIDLIQIDKEKKEKRIITVPINRVYFIGKD